MSRRWSRHLLTLVVVTTPLACGGPQPWQPAAPHGTTYEYDYQGYRSSDTTVVGGSRYGFPAYGAAFSFRDYKGVHDESAGKDPFVQSAPIDGVRFNDHLQGQGARLTPSAPPGGAR